jgi:hypothetical protein
MSRVTGSSRCFAERLIAIEKRAKVPTGDETATVGRIMEKLRPQIATLMGKNGFRALLQRALVLASQEVSWMHHVGVNQDGVLEGWDRHARELEKKNDEDGTVLLAHLVSLLVAFIGEDLTLRMTMQAWPQLSPTELEFDKGPQK